MSEMIKLTIHTDGGSRGNPGPAAIGVYITDSENKVIAVIKKGIGIATNNVAEVTAVMVAMDWLVDAGLPEIRQVSFLLDSLLVVSQLTGKYRIKDKNLFVLYQQIGVLRQKLAVPLTFTHIPRELNKEADRLVNEAFDQS